LIFARACGYLRAMIGSPRPALAPLFAALIAGCTTTTDTGCKDDRGEDIKEIVELTPDEYEQLQMGTGASPTTGGDTGGGGTAGDPAGSTGDTTTAPGTPLTDQEICAMVCANATGGAADTCSIGPLDADGKIPVECVTYTICVGGRRHACVRSHGDAAGHDPAAAWLARAAHDEAASVHAFLALGAELLALGAPPGLLARIDAAIADERRHAALVGAIARRRGAAVPTPSIAPTPARDLLALAVENMVEGCVRETWAALTAAHQARHADTAELRAAYAGIAADEARHAELAWAIDAWLQGQLGAAERAMVAAARRVAVRQLQVSLAAAADEPDLRGLGLPGRDRARQLLSGLDGALWSRAA